MSDTGIVAASSDGNNQPTEDSQLVVESPPPQMVVFAETVPVGTSPHSYMDPTESATLILTDIFHYLDFDKNGYIGKEELRLAMEISSGGIPAREDILDAMILLGDANGDGLIDIDEFILLHQNPREAFARVQQMVSAASKKPGTPSSSDPSSVQSRLQLPPPSTALVPPVPMPIEATEAKPDEAVGGILPADTSSEGMIAEDAVQNLKSSEIRKKTIEIVHALLGITEIKAKDIKVMYKRFMELDTKKTGRLNLLQFTKIFDKATFITNRKLKTNYINTLFNFCDSDSSNFVDSKEFITTLCWLGNFSNIDKLRFSFMLFDINGDGVMDRDEINQLLNSISIGEIEKDVIAERVDDILKKASHDSPEWMDYTLTFEEMVQVADENPDLFNVMGGGEMVNGA